MEKDKLEVVKFETAHMVEMLAKESNRFLRPYLTPEHNAVLEKSPYSYSAFVNGELLACAGIVPYCCHRGEGWAVFNREATRKHFLKLHNAAKRFIEICPLKRVEASVNVNYTPGHRWVKALGFECEAVRMRSHGQGGEDNSLYARIKEF